MNRLRDRRLELGRGRAYFCGPGWFVDYRDLEGSLYSAWAETLPAAHDWIQEKAEAHAVH